MNKVLLWIIGVIIVMSAGYYFYSKKPTTPVSSEPIKLGFIAALTGAGSAIGEEEYKGAQLAIEEINNNGGVNGRPLELIAEDVSIDKMKVAGIVTNKLINIDKVVAIVGPQWDEPATAIIPIIDKSKMSTVSQNTTPDVESRTPSDYFFGTFPDNRVGIKELLRFAEKKNWKNITILRSLDGGFWQYTRNIFIEEAPKYGIAIVDDINIGNPGETDFRTYIAKAKQKKQDVLFFVMSDFNQCVFMKQNKELGLNKPVLATESAGNLTALRNCPDLLDIVYFSTPRSSSRYNDFETKFVAQFQNKPQVPTAITAYDAVGIIAEALKQTKGEGGEVLKNAIAKIKNYPGASLDAIIFNEKGFVVTPDDAFEVRTVRDGSFVKAHE